MSQLSQQDEWQEGDCSSTEDRRQRKHDRRSASSSSAPEDRSSQVIVDVVQKRRNEPRCSYRAGTLEQLREVIGRRVDRACTRCGMGLAASEEHRGGTIMQLGLPYLNHLQRVTCYQIKCLVIKYTDMGFPYIKQSI